MRPLGAADPKAIGPYQLLGVLGSGGMGRVYLGTSRTGRRVAIKVIRPDLAEDPIFRDRFAREVAAAGRVSPLFTALVVDSDTEAPAPWLATTYIEGVSLDRQVLDDGPLSIDDVLSLAAGLGEALTSIHSVGLVHRDLKPSNILLNDSGPHIIDFGLALGNEQTRLTTSRVVGTPAYMAPERLRGEAAGPPSDVFSLGATLVFASTGRDLVDDASVYEQVLQIAEGRFTLTDVPSRLRALVIRCVSFQAEDRPTAAELTRFVVALGAVTPGLSVEDVTIKISTKHRAEARAAGVPIRTTPRGNGDPDIVPTDDQPVDGSTPEGWPEQDSPADDIEGEATPADKTPAAAAASSTAGSKPGSSGLGGSPGNFGPGSSGPGSSGPGRSGPGGARSERLRAVIAPRSTSEGHSAAVNLAWTPSAPAGGVRGPMAEVPVAGGPVAGSPPGGSTPFGAGSGDPDGDWRPSHPSDPNLGAPPFDLLPPKPGWSRRQLITAGGATAAVVATGGVLAAVKLAARQQSGSLTPNLPPIANTPSPGIQRPSTTATSPSNAPVTAGTVLWTASSGAGPAGLQGQNLPGGQRVLVTPSGVILAVRNENRKVVALTPAGKVLWSVHLVSAEAAMWFWGNGVLIADGAWLMLCDLAKGTQKFHLRASDLAGNALVPGHGTLRVTGIALNSTVAYVGIGSAIVAINRAGKAVTSLQGGGFLARTPETPTAASASWVVTQTVGLQSFVFLYRVGSRDPAWESPAYTPIGFNPGGDPAPAATDDPDLRLVEARIVGGVVVARSESDVRAFSLSDLSPQWHRTDLDPVHAIEAMDVSVLVASTTRLTKYDSGSGIVQWHAPVAAIRLAVLSQPKRTTLVVAATAGGVVGVDSHGNTIWSAHLPVGMTSAAPTGITIGPHTAYVSFEQPDGSPDGSPDVVAIALDDKAHR